MSEVLQRQHQAVGTRAVLLTATLAMAAVACGRSEPRVPDLPQQPDAWVSAVTLDSDSKVQYVGKTQEYIVTSVTTVRDVKSPQAVRVGDEIEGIRIGAIRCSFHWRDAYYAREQYMWRGRWACQAGRSRDEVEKAVDDDGKKRFDYIVISPVSNPD